MLTYTTLINIIHIVKHKRKQKSKKKIYIFFYVHHVTYLDESIFHHFPELGRKFNPHIYECYSLFYVHEIGIWGPTSGTCIKQQMFHNSISKKLNVREKKLHNYLNF